MTIRASEPPLKLSLIGDNIATSRSSRIHVEAGRERNLAVTYDRPALQDTGLASDTLFAHQAIMGYRGANITYPYKENAAGTVCIPDPLVAAIGAANTPDGAVGHTGCLAAYRCARADFELEQGLMIGTGRVGRSVAFGLAALKAAKIRLINRHTARAHPLTADLRRAGPDLAVAVFATAEMAALKADGINNCTPVGMVRHDDPPIDADALVEAAWTFDAVCTSVETQFLCNCATVAAGLDIISEYELFFCQGVRALETFQGGALDEPALHTALKAPTL